MNGARARSAVLFVLLLAGIATLFSCEFLNQLFGFTPYSLSISISPDGAGSVTRNPNANFYANGAQVELTATAAGDWVFSHWDGQGSGSSNPYSLVMDSSKEVTAVFERVTSDSARLTDFRFATPSTSGTVNETAHTVAVTVPYRTDVTNLVAVFTATGSTVRIGNAVQVSGMTANDFTDPVTYTVVAADGSTQDYRVTVTVGSADAKALMGFQVISPEASGTIDETAHTVAVTIPYGTDVTSLAVVFSMTGIEAKVGNAPQISGMTANDFTNPVTYTVVAADGSTQDYLVTVTMGPADAKSLTGFGITAPESGATVDEAAHTVSVTVPYGTDVMNLVAVFRTTGIQVKVGNTVQGSGMSANDFTDPVTYTVVAADGSTRDYLVSVTVSPSDAKSLTGFGIVSPEASATIDETARTVSMTVPGGTDVAGLVAVFTATGILVKVGDAVQGSGMTANDFTNPVTYTVVAADGSTRNYVVTVTVSPSREKALTSFGIVSPEADGTIDGTEHAVSVNLRYGTDPANLAATFTTTGVQVRIGETVQASGTTRNDFTNPVIYTVIAADGSAQDYLVTVTVSPSGGKALTGFWFVAPEADGTIDEAVHAVSVTVPNGTDVSGLIAAFSTTGSLVKVGEKVQTSGMTGNDFTNPVIYTVAAADGSQQDYTVTVTAALSGAKALTGFWFDSPASSGTIKESAHSVTVTVPYGTDVSGLTATFTTTGARVKVGETEQVSGTTANDFTGRVTYTVVAADGSTQDYAVIANRFGFSVSPSPGVQHNHDSAYEINATDASFGNYTRVLWFRDGSYKLETPPEGTYSLNVSFVGSSTVAARFYSGSILVAEASQVVTGWNAAPTQPSSDQPTYLYAKRGTEVDFNVSSTDPNGDAFRYYFRNDSMGYALTNHPFGASMNVDQGWVWCPPDTCTNKSAKMLFYFMALDSHGAQSDDLQVVVDTREWTHVSLQKLSATLRATDTSAPVETYDSVKWYLDGVQVLQSPPAAYYDITVDWIGDKTLRMETYEGTRLKGFDSVVITGPYTSSPVYSVTYYDNGSTGGKVPVDGGSYSMGQMVTVLGNTGLLVKAGSLFAGWNTRADGNGIPFTEAQSFAMGSSTVALYARWVPLDSISVVDGRQGDYTFILTVTGVNGPIAPDTTGQYVQYFVYYQLPATIHADTVPASDTWQWYWNGVLISNPTNSPTLYVSNYGIRRLNYVTVKAKKDGDAFRSATVILVGSP